MHKSIKSSVKFVKKEIKSYIQRPKPSYFSTNSIGFENRIKHNSYLLNRGKKAIIELLKTKRKNKIKSEFKKIDPKHKAFFTRKNMKLILAYIFSDFSVNQLEDMLLFLFGDLSEEERYDVLSDIIDGISEKEYGFLLKD